MLKQLKHIKLEIRHGETSTSNLKPLKNRIWKDSVMVPILKNGKVPVGTKSKEEVSSIHRKSASLEFHPRQSTFGSKWETTLTGLTSQVAILLVCSMLSWTQLLNRSRFPSNKSWPRLVSLFQFPWRSENLQFRANSPKKTRITTLRCSLCRALRVSHSVRLWPSSWESLKSSKMLRSTPESSNSSSLILTKTTTSRNLLLHTRTLDTMPRKLLRSSTRRKKKKPRNEESQNIQIQQAKETDDAMDRDAIYAWTQVSRHLIPSTKFYRKTKSKSHTGEFVLI